jgi:hypothetical protein
MISTLATRVQFPDVESSILFASLSGISGCQKYRRRLLCGELMILRFRQDLVRADHNVCATQAQVTNIIILFGTSYMIESEDLFGISAAVHLTLYNLKATIEVAASTSGNGIRALDQSATERLHPLAIH